MTIDVGVPGETGERALECPRCKGRGRAVKAVTIESLVHESARRAAGCADGFRFCAAPHCDIAYYRPETGERFLRGDVKVRIGQKELVAPHAVCYCFDHSIEEIEAEVARTGASSIANEITAKCRQGLDRCEETNPQGSCCLGNVRKALKDAQGRSAHLPSEREQDGGAHDCCNTHAHEERS